MLMVYNSIVGASTTSLFPTFRTSLLFAQEYGILAASLEDRPFVPISTVVLEGTPLGVKGAFRKWEDERQSTRGCESEGKEATVIPLSAALEATGGQGGR